MSPTVARTGRASRRRARERKAIVVSCWATAFEQHDFRLAGALAADVGKAFFSWSSAEPVFVFSVFDFAAGDAARPRGASTFGRLRDAIGRTYAALRATLTIGAPAAIGVVLRRMIQSLAIGGDAGGAAIDVAEHAPRKRRGSLASSVQT